MDTSGTEIALGTIFALLCFFPHLSIADVMYHPVGLLTKDKIIIFFSTVNNILEVIFASNSI